MIHMIHGGIQCPVHFTWSKIQRMDFFFLLETETKMSRVLSVWCFSSTHQVLSAICVSVTVLENLFIHSHVKITCWKIALSHCTPQAPTFSPPSSLTFSSALCFSLLLQPVTHHHYFPRYWIWASISHFEVFFFLCRTCSRVPCSLDFSISDTKYDKLHFLSLLPDGDNTKTFQL